MPIINAGDGGHNHPTQTLTDLFTIKREKGRFCNLTIGLCGDLKFGRTVHSLILAMSRYENVKFVLISPDELELPDYITHDVLEKKNIAYKKTNNLEEVMGELDILYMTRVQRERFFNEADYIRLKDTYILDSQKLEGAKKELCIMHPLPRVNEISVKVDEDPRAVYFRQTLYGRYMRQALILKLLTEKDYKEPKPPKMIKSEVQCKNQRCISQTEQELEHVYKLVNEEHQIYRCIYCESKMKMPQTID